MLYSELAGILANPESSKIEFKRDDIRPLQLAREIVALANFRGGRIFLGIDDATREVVGIQRSNCEEWIMDTVFSRYITPPMIPVYEEIMTPDNLKVAVLSIEQGTLKPYAVRDHDRETIYIRIGSTSRIATRDQILRMSQEAGSYHFETAPVSGSSVNDLDYDLFQFFYRSTYGDDVIEVEVEETLTRYDLLVSSSFDQKVCSICGLILFGKDIRKFLPQHGIRIIHYPGDDISLESVSDVVLTSAVGRITDGSEIRRSGLVDHTIQHLSEKLAKEEIGSDEITRLKQWSIPVRVLRELVINSIIHRDYTRPGRNEIRLFRDRIEIESQGRLPNTMTIEKMKAGQKYARNPILVQHAQFMGLMEHKGLGIRKIVMEELARLGFSEPGFKETEDTFTVTVYLKKQIIL